MFRDRIFHFVLNNIDAVEIVQFTREVVQIMRVGLVAIFAAPAVAQLVVDLKAGIEDATSLKAEPDSVVHETKINHPKGLCENASVGGLLSPRQ